MRVLQVLLSAGVGTAANRKNVIDVWWNTNFLGSEGNARKREDTARYLFIVPSTPIVGRYGVVVIIQVSLGTTKYVV